MTTTAASAAAPTLSDNDNNKNTNRRFRRMAFIVVCLGLLALQQLWGNGKKYKYLAQQIMSSSITTTASSTATLSDVCHYADDLPFMTVAQARKIITQVYQELTENSHKPLPENTRIYEAMGQALLRHAGGGGGGSQQKQRLLTLQIGGNDGISNDPLYNMFVRHNRFERTDMIPYLRHWNPIVVEPVPENFVQLVRNYRTKIPNLTCFWAVPWAMKYSDDDNDDKHNNQPTTTTCNFYRFNVSNTEPACRDAPDWMRTQIGTLQAENLKLQPQFRSCAVTQQVPCGTMTQLLETSRLSSLFGHDSSSTSTATTRREDHQNSRHPKEIVWWQIDTEGYEYYMIPAMLQGVTAATTSRNNGPNSYVLPALISYESKVMLYRDQHYRTNQTAHVRSVLRQVGYTVLEHGGDDLAMRLLPAGQ